MCSIYCPVLAYRTIYHPKVWWPYKGPFCRSLLATQSVGFLILLNSDFRFNFKQFLQTFEDNAVSATKAHLEGIWEVVASEPFSFYGKPSEAAASRGRHCKTNTAVCILANPLMADTSQGDQSSRHSIPYIKGVCEGMGRILGRHGIQVGPNHAEGFDSC